MSQFTDKKLRQLGFQRRDIGNGLHDFVRSLDTDWTIEITGDLVELVHNGNAVMLRCDNEQKLEQLINVL